MLRLTKIATADLEIRRINSECEVIECASWRMLLDRALRDECAASGGFGIVLTGLQLEQALNGLVSLIR